MSSRMMRVAKSALLTIAALEAAAGIAAAFSTKYITTGYVVTAAENGGCEIRTEEKSLTSLSLRLAAARPEGNLEEKMGRTVRIIQAGNGNLYWSGAGYELAEGVILTAAHVVNNSDNQLAVYKASGFIGPGTVLAEDKNADLALIKVELPYWWQVTGSLEPRATRLPVYTGTNEPLSVATFKRTVMIPRAAQLVPVVKVEGRDNYYNDTTAELDPGTGELGPGSSGSAIIGESGLVSIIQSMIVYPTISGSDSEGNNSSSTISMGEFYGVDHDVLIDFLQRSCQPKANAGVVKFSANQKDMQFYETHTYARQPPKKLALKR